MSLRFDSYSFCDWAKSNFLAYWLYRWHFQHTTIRSWISKHICWFLYDLIIYPWLNFKAAHSKSLWARDLVSNYIPQNDNRKVFLSHLFSFRASGNLAIWDIGCYLIGAELCIYTSVYYGGIRDSGLSPVGSRCQSNLLRHIGMLTKNALKISCEHVNMCPCFFGPSVLTYLLKISWWETKSFRSQSLATVVIIAHVLYESWL